MGEEGNRNVDCASHCVMGTTQQLKQVDSSCGPGGILAIENIGNSFRHKRELTWSSAPRCKFSVDDNDISQNRLVQKTKVFFGEKAANCRAG